MLAMNNRPSVGVMLDRALALYEMGLKVIPLGDPWTPPPPWVKGEDEEARAKAWCKRARVKWEGFKKIAPEEAQIREWWAKWPYANIGVITGELLVIDADNKAADTWLGENITRTPVMSRTARGHHRWYRMPKAISISISASSVGIDFRGEGGYVVANGSTYANGVVNEWVIAPGWDLNDFDELPELTAEDLGNINRFGGHWCPATPEGEPVLADLARIRLPHDGRSELPGGRNTALASLVGTWIQHGLSTQQITTRAAEWNAANPQPLAIGEVLTTVSSVLATHIRHHGATPPALPPPAGALEILSFGELRDHPPALPETFWRDGVIFRGARVLVAGPPKIGKSNFIIQLAMAAACGGEFLAHHFARPLRVLWLQAEIHKSFLFPRLDRISGYLSLEERALAQQNFFMSGRCDLDLCDETSRELVERVIGDCAPDMVFIDPIINFSTADENDNAEVRRLLRQIDALGEKHQCTMVLVHHTRKGAIDAFESIRGASALRGWFDTGFLLSGKPENIVLSQELRNTRHVPASGLEHDEHGRLYPCELAIQPGESADPTIGGVMPRNAENQPKPRTVPTDRTNQPQRTKQETIDHLITTHASTVLHLVQANQPIGYSELKRKIHDVLKLKNGVVQAGIITQLCREGLIVGERTGPGRPTFYRLTDQTDQTDLPSFNPVSETGSTQFQPSFRPSFNPVSDPVSRAGASPHPPVSGGGRAQDPGSVGEEEEWETF